MTTEGIPADLSAIEAALGRMVYRAGNLEAVVRYTGGRLATTDQQREALDGVSAGALVKQARQLARNAAADDRISQGALFDLVKLLDEINVHLKSRNTYIHGMWVARANGQPFVILSQKKREVQTRPLVPEELGRLSDTLLTLSNDVFDWTDRILGALGDQAPDGWDIEETVTTPGSRGARADGFLGGRGGAPADPASASGG